MQGLSNANIQLLVALGLALSISMLVIPIMMRLAPRLGMVDRPSARKVHAVPMARVGGWGIAIGTLVPVLLWAPHDPLVLSYAFACVVLIVSGTLDDTRELGHYLKFIGQFVAVTPVVVYGGLVVESFPFMGFEPLPASIGVPFTIIAIVGMINAINHADGLDGLAGGESLLSLVVMGFLAWTAGGALGVLVAVTGVGGLLGFLRFNTHPARVFMGDVGSQFLGFNVGFLAVLLTQQINPALSPAAAVLLLGLPIADILAVLAQRIHRGMNWFRASRNHIHHRLLDLGFSHHESVVMIYAVQALLVSAGVVLCYESDGLLIGIYLAVCAALFGALTWAERSGWRRGTRARGLLSHAYWSPLLRRPAVRMAPVNAVALLVPVYLLLNAVLCDDVPRDIALLSVLMFVAALGAMLLPERQRAMVLRSALYTASAAVVYLGFNDSQSVPLLHPLADLLVLAAIAIGVAVAVRFSLGGRFATTPMDFLALFILLAVGLFGQAHHGGTAVGAAVLKALVLLYGCELLLHRGGPRLVVVAGACLPALGVLGARGLL